MVEDNINRAPSQKERARTIDHTQPLMHERLLCGVCVYMHVYVWVRCVCVIVWQSSSAWPPSLPPDFFIVRLMYQTKLLISPSGKMRIGLFCCSAMCSFNLSPIWVCVDSNSEYVHRIPLPKIWHKIKCLSFARQIIICMYSTAYTCDDLFLKLAIIR